MLFAQRRKPRAGQRLEGQLRSQSSGQPGWRGHHESWLLHLVCGPAHPCFPPGDALPSWSSGEFGTSEPPCGWHDRVSASWDMDVEGMQAKGPQTKPRVCGALGSHAPAWGGQSAVRAQAFLSNHSGCDLKMDSVAWCSSQSHSAFQSDFKREPL